MQWLWTWGGRCFGYREGDDLWTYNGRHVGKFVGDDVYGPDGRYLGELINGDRLITQVKKAWRPAGFPRWGKRVGYAKFVDYVGFTMYAGYEDFPELEK